MNTNKKYTIITILITILAALTTIKAESKTLLIITIALAIFSYILWNWDETPQVKTEKQ
jgi:hypothetical protein